MYGLLDANVTAVYYLARSMKNAKASKVLERMGIIVDSVRTKGSDLFLYIPNICIAEVFGVFAKYAFGKWNQHLKGIKTIDKRVYRKLVKQFRHDIHNGRVLYQYELSRYHVLAQDLVAPIDHYFQHRRETKRRKKTRPPIRPMGTFDRLYVAMGILLAHVHGADNVVLLTADDRIADIVGKCREGVRPSTIRKLKLEIAEEVTGRKFGPGLFPRCLNLKTATETELKEVFGQWPLPVKGNPAVYRK